MLKVNPASGWIFSTELFILLGRITMQMCTWMPLMGCDQWFTSTFRQLEELWWDNLDKGGLEKEATDRPFWMGKNHEDIHVPCECSPQGNLSRENNDQVVGGPILSLSTGLMTKVVMMAAMELMYGGSNLHSPRLTWSQPLLSAESANSRSEHWVSNMALFLERPAWCQGDYTEPLPSYEE